MPISKKYYADEKLLFRDVRPWSVRLYEAVFTVDAGIAVTGILILAMLDLPLAGSGVHFYGLADLFLIIALLFAFAVKKRGTVNRLKLPQYSREPDPNDKDHKGKPKKAEGMVYLGIDTENDGELWLGDGDIRTHVLYLGTTGAGKTEGLKSLCCNALCWGSGFLYIDGKADTDLWAAHYAMARRFGRDDDVLVLNYMTGNSDLGGASNSLNPFSSGSASYLTNMMTQLMDEAGGDNAMWKGRAVSLLASLMPALTWKRDNEGLLLDVGVIRDHLVFGKVIALSRDKNLPDKIKRGLVSYLDTLPGYVAEAFDDDGNEKPVDPQAPMMDLSVVRQQHGYLSMQFTRSLQSLADEYGYIFSTQLADVDMLDVVLNRRIVVVLIPSLEKSGDEAANLGKIVAAAIKGMMGSTLGASVEGEWSSIIENKMTRASSPFMTVFDEVGYYTTEGMGVMAAQARSLGFSLIYAAQDLAALEKRVKEEARSITANCNLKLFGKLEDSQDTKDFFEKTVGQELITEASSYSVARPGALMDSYSDRKDAGFQARGKADFGELKKMKQGEVVMCWTGEVIGAKFFYANPKKLKSIRIHRMLGVDPGALNLLPRDDVVTEVYRNLRDAKWSAAGARKPVDTPAEIEALAWGFKTGRKDKQGLLQCGALAIASLADLRAREAGQDGLVAPEAKAAKTSLEKPATDAPPNLSKGPDLSRPSLDVPPLTKPAATPAGAGDLPFSMPDLGKPGAAAGSGTGAAGGDTAQKPDVEPVADIGTAPLSWAEVTGKAAAAGAGTGAGTGTGTQTATQHGGAENAGTGAEAGDSVIDFTLPASASTPDGASRPGEAGQAVETILRGVADTISQGLFQQGGPGKPPAGNEGASGDSEAAE